MSVAHKLATSLLIYIQAFFVLVIQNLTLWMDKLNSLLLLGMECIDIP